MKFTPHEYQRRGIDWIMEHPRCCLFWEMGLGKSVVTLTALQRMIDDCTVSSALIVAPKKVAESTWTDEATKWEHLNLSVELIAGTAKQRREAIEREADIHVVGRDNFVWLMEQTHGRLRWDCIVIDELSSFKTPSSRRSKAMRKAQAQAARMIGLTGTPAPNGFFDLWSQICCIDGGARLGRFVTHYEQTYFNAYKMNGVTIRRTLRKGAAKAIESRLSDICLTMRAEDYLTLPPLIDTERRVTLPPAVMESYREFERERVLEIMAQNEESKIDAASAAALMNKLAQYANGFVYDANKVAFSIHEEKLTALREVVEEAASPVLAFYQYVEDKERILKAFGKKMKVETYEGAETLKRWNAGEIDLLLAHPASTAYGLNMQKGGHVAVWYGTGWNLELWQQANARLHRQGQTKPVTVVRLIAAGTVDERMSASLSQKEGTQLALLRNLSYLCKQVKGL